MKDNAVAMEQLKTNVNRIFQEVSETKLILTLVTYLVVLIATAPVIFNNLKAQTALSLSDSIIYGVWLMNILVWGAFHFFAFRVVEFLVSELYNIYMWVTKGFYKKSFYCEAEIVGFERALVGGDLYLRIGNDITRVSVTDTYLTIITGLFTVPVKASRIATTGTPRVCAVDTCLGNCITLADSIEELRLESSRQMELTRSPLIKKLRCFEPLQLEYT